MSRYNVAVVIANYNGEAHLRRLLPTLRQQTYTSVRLVLVDNGSNDGSLAYTRSFWPDAVSIANTINTGFSKANNQGIVRALEDASIQYIATLNNDTIVDREWLAKLVDVLERNLSVGAVASKVLSMDDTNVFDSAGDFLVAGTVRVRKRGYAEIDNGQYDRPDEPFSVGAVAALYRREALEESTCAGEFFDEDFGSYIEDIDISWRMRLCGWRLWYEPKALVYHKGFSTSRSISSEYPYRLTVRNRILWCIKALPVSLFLLLVKEYVYGIYTVIRRGYTPPALRTTKSGQKPFFTVSNTVRLGAWALWQSCILLPAMMRKRRWLFSRKKISVADMREIFRTYVIYD